MKARRGREAEVEGRTSVQALLTMLTLLPLQPELLPIGETTDCNCSYLNTTVQYVTTVLRSTVHGCYSKE